MGLDGDGMDRDGLRDVEATRVGRDGHVSWGEPKAMASGRQGRAEASIIASAVELAPLAKRLATTAGRMVAANPKVTDPDGIIPRILSLAASIEGMVGGPIEPPGASGKRAFLRDLSVGEIYATHLHSIGDENTVEWSLVAGDESGSGSIVVSRDGVLAKVVAADWGLCAYGVGGAWHPYAWTESVGGRVTDGKDIARMVDAEAELGAGMEDDEWGTFPT